MITNGTATKRKHDVSHPYDGTSKRQKGAVMFPGHTPSRQDLEIRQKCAPNLFDAETFESYRQQYVDSKPYQHGVIPSLMNDALLRDVRLEIQRNLSFTAKETDIYKIFQSGDLANLSGLDDSSLSRLPSLVELRNVLYSAEFRRYISGVTESGPLSGRKTDMAINCYGEGCHLLCHDDVIGSRRVSYILYLVDPDTPWRGEWGGALRLYPTEETKILSETGLEEGTVLKSPSPHFSRVIPPAWNQLAFFVVQPGESFHDVEEVYARKEGENDDRMRMAISGWFHLPQLGEEGYEEGREEELAQSSSLAQLQAKSDELDLPQPQWRDYPLPPDGLPNEDDEAEVLTQQELDFLLQYMRPQYLTPDTVDQLTDLFADESTLQLAEFLSDKFAAKLRAYLEGADKTDPPTNAEVKDSGIARPPHKHRFVYHQPVPPAKGPFGASPPGNAYEELIDKFFPSVAFKKWLSLATGLTLTKSNVLGRRFRRGKDYTLATGYEEPDPQLEVCLGVTPSGGWDAEDVAGAEGKGKMEDRKMWDDIVKLKETAVGGYEMYMAADDVDADEGEGEGEGVAYGEKAESKGKQSNTGAGNRPHKKQKLDPAVYQSGTGDEDDGVLFSMPACWNSMSVVLRDRGVLKFVKYVSHAANGDRWDIVGEFGVSGADDDEDGENGLPEEGDVLEASAEDDEDDEDD